jgi:hypothetical protein
VDVVRRSDCSAWRWGGRDHVSGFLPTHRAGREGEQALIRLKIWKVVRQVSSTAFLSLLMVTFVCIGFVLAIVMGRLGRSPFAWGLLGLVLGPIAMLLALVEVRNERPWWTRLVASGDPGSGPVDVLVGIDGSPESAAPPPPAWSCLATVWGGSPWWR